MNKVIVITGASSGIGLQLKKNYQKDGDIVINLSRSAQEDEFNFKVDVSNKELICLTFEKIYNKYKKIDVLINCAGYGVFGANELLEEEKCKKIFDVNFYGTLWCCQSALKYMTKGAKIINISSACALFALPFRSMYSASKSAVNMMTYGLRMELKNYGIKVCCICPGDIKSNFSKNRDITFATNEKYQDRIIKSVKKIEERENGRMDLIKTSKKIYKICNKNRLKAVYIVGAKYKCLNFFSKFASISAILNITNNFF